MLLQLCYCMEQKMKILIHEFCKFLIENTVRWSYLFFNGGSLVGVGGELESLESLSFLGDLWD